VGALFLESWFVEVPSGIPAHPTRTRGESVRQASDVARVAASVTTIVPGHAPLHSFSLMPPVGSGAHMENLAPRQLPNKRLKLAGPGPWGKLSFVTNQAKRRSLSAGR